MACARSAGFAELASWRQWRALTLSSCCCFRIWSFVCTNRWSMLSILPFCLRTRACSALRLLGIWDCSSFGYVSRPVLGDLLLKSFGPSCNNTEMVAVRYPVNAILMDTRYQSSLLLYMYNQRLSCWEGLGGISGHLTPVSGTLLKMLKRKNHVL